MDKFSLPATRTIFFVQKLAWLAFEHGFSSRENLSIYAVHTSKKNLSRENLSWKTWSCVRGLIHFTFLSDKGPLLETFDLVFRISTVHQHFYIWIYIVGNSSSVLRHSPWRGTRCIDESEVILIFLIASDSLWNCVDCLQENIVKISQGQLWSC